MATPKQTVVEEELGKRRLERSLEQVSRTAFPLPIRSTSPSRPRPAGSENNEPPRQGRRDPRPAAPFSHSRRNRSLFLKISGNWPIIRLESSAFTGFGERWLENISALTASAAVPTGRLRRNWRSRSGRRRA